MKKTKSVFLFFLFFFITLSSVFSFQIITEDPFEKLLADIICPRLNLSDNHCLLLLTELTNKTPIIQEITVVENYTKTVLVDNSTIIEKNNTIELQKLIVVNQTLVINQTKSIDYFQHVENMRKLDIEASKAQPVDLSGYYTRNEVDIKISQALTDHIPPTTSEVHPLSSITAYIVLLLLILIVGGLFYLNFMKWKSGNPSVTQTKVIYRTEKGKQATLKPDTPELNDEELKEEVKKSAKKGSEKEEISEEPTNDIFADEEFPTEY